MKKKQIVKTSTMIHKRNEKGNQLMLSQDGEYFMVCGQGKYFTYIDHDDWDKLKDLRWGTCGHYLRTTMEDGDGKQTWRRLHTIVLPGGHRGKVIDHVNRDPFDNRKANLEFKTMRENLENSDHRDRERVNKQNNDTAQRIGEEIVNDRSMWLNNRSPMVSSATSRWLFKK